MKRILVIAFLVLTVVAQAQVKRGLKGDFNTSEYPKISFVWNTADPIPLDKSQFVLTENGKNIDFDFSILKDNDANPRKKSILFLWEDMASHSHQSECVQELIFRFFKQTEISPEDRFNIAVFNRLNPGDKSVIHPLHSDFISDVDRMLPWVLSYELSKVRYKKDQYPEDTDLYLAISEGIDMLKKEPIDRTGVIVVFTAGRNLKASGASTEMETVREKALEAGIPIYVVKYHELYGDTPEVNALAKGTNGDVVKMSYDNVKKEVNQAALVDMQQMYKDIDSRYNGPDYKITFITSAPRDGKPHEIGLTIKKVPQQIRPFTAPERTFGLWVQENLWLCIGLIVLVLLIIALVIVLIISSSNKRKRREEENAAQFQSKIDAANRERAKLERDIAAKDAQQKVDAQRKADEAEAARLFQSMRNKNMFPRLQCTVGGSTFSYAINKPVTRIGRAETNDVVLNNQTVSKFHAEIVFSGGAFEVINKSTSYQQGIVVNGQFFQKATLKSGDIIGLGEAVVTFYV